jgi:hypothetical protein
MSQPSTPSTPKIATGDRVVYKGKEYWAKASGTAVYLFDNAELKGPHVCSPRTSSVVKVTTPSTPSRIQTGDLVVYKGKEYWAQANGTNVYLFDNPKLEGAWIHAPRTTSVVKVTTPGSKNANGIATPASPYKAPAAAAKQTAAKANGTAKEPPSKSSTSSSRLATTMRMTTTRKPAVTTTMI